MVYLVFSLQIKAAESDNSRNKKLFRKCNAISVQYQFHKILDIIDDYTGIKNRDKKYFISNSVS